MTHGGRGGCIPPLDICRMVKKYVCAELDEQLSQCKRWVEYYSLLDDLAITKSEMVMISTSLIAVFSVILGFVILAKAVKSM